LPLARATAGTSTALPDRVADIAWYHSLRLPGGIVTPGEHDTLAELERVPFPPSLEGRRCLDVGTANGFWAFEMERRGATEVLAIDLCDPARLDWPGRPKSDEEMRAILSPALARRDGFDIAHEALGSSVEWRELSVYELSPTLVGRFDFAFVGSLLLHLRDPVAGLAAIRRVLDGELLSVDAISPRMTLLHPTRPVARFEALGSPLWWLLNLPAYRRIFGGAGFEIVASGRPFFLRPGRGYRAAPRTRRGFYGRLRERLVARQGVLHAWVRARAMP